MHAIRRRRDERRGKEREKERQRTVFPGFSLQFVAREAQNCDSVLHSSSSPDMRFQRHLSLEKTEDPPVFLSLHPTTD